MVESDVRIACIPEEGVLSVDAPVRFIAMHHIGDAYCVAEIFVQMGSLCCRAVGESHRRGRHEGHAEKSREYFANVTVGQFHFVTQIHRRRFGYRPDTAIAQFSVRRLKHFPATVRTIGQLMYVFRYHRPGLQDDVFLDLDMCFINGFKSFPFAVWTDRWRGHGH